MPSISRSNAFVNDLVGSASGVTMLLGLIIMSSNQACMTAMSFTQYTRTSSIPFAFNSSSFE